MKSSPVIISRKAWDRRHQLEVAVHCSLLFSYSLVIKAPFCRKLSARLVIINVKCTSGQYIGCNIILEAVHLVLAQFKRNIRLATCKSKQHTKQDPSNYMHFCVPHASAIKP